MAPTVAQHLMNFISGAYGVDLPQIDPSLVNNLNLVLYLTTAAAVAGIPIGASIGALYERI